MTERVDLTFVAMGEDIVGAGLVGNTKSNVLNMGGLKYLGGTQVEILSRWLDG